MPDRSPTLLLAAGLGVVAGLRSAAAPALLSRRLARTPWPGRGAAVRLLTAPLAVALLPLAAVGELVMDKLPVTPARTDPAPLAGRVASGALCGAAVASCHRRGAVGGAVAGGLGAVAGAFLGYHVRRAAAAHTDAPDLAVALAEDAATYALGSLLAATAVP